MIWPTRALCPAKSFTPRYLGAESRIFFAVPEDLVVAIVTEFSNSYENMLSRIDKFVYPILDWLRKHESDIILGMAVLFISLLSFAAGYLTATDQFKEPIQIENLRENEEDQ